MQLNMRWVLPTILVLSLAESGSAFPQKPSQASSEIAGTVRRVGTRRPIQTATVRLLDAGDESVIASTMTSDDGAFRFDGLDPGTYVVEVATQGFAKRRFSAHPKTRQPLRISNAADKIQFDAELYTLSRISGRVVDEKGDGIRGVTVWALANVVATEQGLEWRHLTVLGGTGADGEGNFSIYNLLPGEYFLYAMPTSGSEPGVGFSALPHGAKRALDGYYPQGRSIDEARSVSLGPAETLTDLTIQLTGTQGFCAHGSISGGDGASNNAWHVSAIFDRASRVTRNPISVLRLAPGTQEFTMCGLPAEPLIIELFGPSPGGVAARATLTPRKDVRSEFQLALTATFPLQINARLESETARWCKATELPSAGCYDTGAVRFNLLSPYTYVFMNPRASKDAPGVLSIDAVFTSAYRNVLQLPRGLFVKGARLGLQELIPEEAIVLDGSTRTLDFAIVESQAKLQIEINAAKEFARNVYLVPIGPDAQYWRHIVNVPIPPGDSSAEATGLAPGDYDVVLASGDDPAAALVVMRAAGGLPRVHIEPNKVARISLKH